MEIVEKPAVMREKVLESRQAGKTVGLVPTMGYFHEGHLSLMRAAKRECDVAVVSLFVNPTQFAPGEDLEDYPRDLKRDAGLAEREGVDYLFHPGPEDMYPEGFRTSVTVEGLQEVMCGASREGHFSGVATVVSKLFNIVPAQFAYFGQKDAQQLVIIRRMARDLDFPVEIRAVPTVREEDGLAMSSRNAYLGPEERRAATVLYKSLNRAVELIESGERNAASVRSAMEEVVAGEPLVDLEYIAICDNIYLAPLAELRGRVLIALAAVCGSARLIDNVVVDLE